MKFPPYVSWVLVAGLIKKFTQDRLTIEKPNYFVHMGDHKMMLTEWPKAGSFYYIFLHKQICEDLTGQRNSGLGA